ncbi:hypothetical protein [Blastopirellula marina]|nr:hypothetical protein [Blastopirellula marina]
MKEESVIEFSGDHIYVVGHGFFSHEQSLNLWRRIVAACQQHDCYNILGKAETRQELSTMDSFKHIKIFEQSGISWKHRIAWFAEDPGQFERLKFIETVLRNRALLNGHLFRNKEDARSWLLEDGAAPSNSNQASEST